MPRSSTPFSAADRSHIGTRPIPNDFEATFIQVGWEAIEETVRANKVTIVRWIAAIDRQTAPGLPTLAERRRAYLDEKYAAQGKRVPGRRPGKAARYVLGMTRTPVAAGE